MAWTMRTRWSRFWTLIVGEYPLPTRVPGGTRKVDCPKAGRAHTRTRFTDVPLLTPTRWRTLRATLGRIPLVGAARQRWPDHALVYLAGWNPLFCGAYNLFGMEEALIKMAAEPVVFEACIRKQHEFYMDILRRDLRAGLM